MTATLYRTKAARHDDRPLAARHLLVIDDGGDSLRTALRWARHHLGPDEVVTVLSTYSHLHVAPFSAECGTAFIDDVGNPAELARQRAHRLVGEVFGPDEPGDRVRAVVRCGYPHRVAMDHLCDATDVVIAQTPSGRWPDRLTPSPARRLVGRTTRPLVIIPHDWSPEA